MIAFFGPKWWKEKNDSADKMDRASRRMSAFVPYPRTKSFWFPTPKGAWMVDFVRFLLGRVKNVIFCLSDSHLQNANIRFNFARFVLNSVPSEFLYLLFFFHMVY